MPGPDILVQSQENEPVWTAVGGKAGKATFTRRLAVRIGCMVVSVPQRKSKGCSRQWRGGNEDAKCKRLFFLLSLSV